MNYCIIDETDPFDNFECEGQVLMTYFESSRLFSTKHNLELIRKDIPIERGLKKHKSNYFNIVQISGHGLYEAQTKSRLEYSVIVKKRGRHEIEIFRPESIVRTGLKADVFLSTNCETFNPLFVDILKHYKGISNYIAPVNRPRIGNTLIFSMIFYTLLLRKIRRNSVKISDENIIESFVQTNNFYFKKVLKENFRLYNSKYNQIFK